MATIRGDKNWFFRDDELTGTSRQDFIYGLEGNDFILGGGGNDRLFGGNGEDRLHGGDGADILDGGNHNDVLYGGANDDILLGGFGNDRMYGGANNDTFRDVNGNDRIDGGTGIDTVDYSGFSGQVDANLAWGTATQKEVIWRVGSGQETHSIGTDRLESIENIVGGQHDDSITGSSGANYIAGGLGYDVLKGAGGDDVLVGGRGNDILTGGTGSDTFLFTDTLTNSLDRITDFRPADDVIHLDGATFTALERGALDSDALRFTDDWVPAALDADDRIIVSTRSGLIYYDADGSGSKAVSGVAMLEAPNGGLDALVSSMTAADFFVV